MKNPKSERATEAMYTPSGYYETYNGLSIEADRLDFLAKINDPRVFHRVCTRLTLRRRAGICHELCGLSGADVLHQVTRKCRRGSRKRGIALHAKSCGEKCGNIGIFLYR